jgi:hypothetical protein
MKMRKGLKSFSLLRGLNILRHRILTISTAKSQASRDEKKHKFTNDFVNPDGKKASLER